MPHRHLPLALICLLATITSSALGDVRLSLSVGWESHYRPGRWNPVFVTAYNPEPREVELQLYSPTDGRYAMQIAQEFVVNPSPRTSALYVPLSYGLDESSVTIRDAASGRTINTFDLDHPENRPALLGQPVNLGEMLIGISGNDQTHSLLAAQLRQMNTVCAFLNQRMLPSSPLGYDPLDSLFLNAPNLAQLDLDQQQAIIQWVQSGGILVIWPGTTPLPDSGPLIDALPCKFGETRTYELTQQQLNSLKLPKRFAHVTGRSITAAANGAHDVHLITGSDMLGYRKWVGFGQILALPADVSTFLFQSTSNAHSFWRNALQGTITLPNDDGTPPNEQAEESRRVRADEQAMDWIGTVPGAGTFGFSYLAIALILMMLVVGPVDWFVLKWMGRQPWTWITTSGWIALITVAAISVGYLLKSGDLHFRTVTVIDEADGQRMAQTTLAGIYSPRTREYALHFDPQSWWRPARQNIYRGGNGLQLEIDCHQDYRGNQPLPMLINVWNLRFLEGTTTTPAPGIIAATLTHHGNAIEGSITNQSAVALENVTMQTHDGLIKLTGKLNPGQTLPLSATPIDTKTQPPNAAEIMPLPSTRPTASTGGDISIVRSQRIDQILKDRSDIACVMADFQAPPQEIRLDDPQAKQLHTGMVRALVELK